MENASQALLIAAGVLVGILILSLGVTLFNMMGSYAANTQSDIDKNHITQFNNKFLIYQGLKDLNIQDIVTVKNYALEHNKQYIGYNPGNDRANDNNDYIDVYYDDNKAKAYYLTSNILEKSDEDLLTNEMDSGKEANRFTCDIKINPNTGKVNKIYFYEST